MWCSLQATLSTTPSPTISAVWRWKHAWRTSAYVDAGFFQSASFAASSPSFSRVLQPTEVILPPRLSERTEKLLRAAAVSAVQTDGLREERLSAEAFDAASSARRITAFFESSGETNSAELAAALALPPAVQTCLAAMVHHLTAFRLEKMLRAASSFQPFSMQGTSMLLNASTLHNLEVVANATDGRHEVGWLVKGRRMEGKIEGGGGWQGLTLIVTFLFTGFVTVADGPHIDAVWPTLATALDHAPTS